MLASCHFAPDGSTVICIVIVPYGLYWFKQNELFFENMPFIDSRYCRAEVK